MKKHTFSVLLAFAFTVTPCYAEWSLGGYVSSLSLDEDKARREGVDDSALGLGAIADYAGEGLFAFSTGLEFVFYDDDRQFSQRVEVVGGFDDGEIRTEDSQATGLLFFLDAGPRWRFGHEDSAYFALKGGFGTFVYSERSIGNCTDCYEEDVDIDGSAYVQASLARNFSAASTGLHYTQYFDEEEGLANSFRITVGIRF